MKQIEVILKLNKLGEKHAIEELSKYVVNFEDHNLNAWIDSINSKILEHNDPSYEVGSRYTKTKTPHTIYFNKSQLETEMIELEPC